VDGQGLTSCKKVSGYIIAAILIFGLEMAAVYGIVKNHGGWISVESEARRGTTLQIYFPVNK
jgi:K+-sensing histidine kinase KdpD